MVAVNTHTHHSVPVEWWKRNSHKTHLHDHCCVVYLLFVAGCCCCCWASIMQLQQCAADCGAMLVQMQARFE